MTKTPELEAATEAASQEANMDIGRDHLVAIVQGYLRSTCVGLVVTNPQIPSNVMWDVVVDAFGRLMSEVTTSNDIAATLRIRGHLSDTFARNIRLHRAAIQAANGNGGQIINVKPN